MLTRRALLAATGTLAAPFAGCTGGGEGTPDDRDAPTDAVDDGEDDGDAGGLSLSSPAFDGGTVPTAYTCDGEDVSPPLRVDGVPDGAASLALVVDDPDAPTDEPFVHWLLWNVPPDTTEIPEDVPDGERVDALDGAAQGTSGFGDVGYGGPCPPEGDGPHTYRFTLHALDAELDVEPGAERGALEPAMDDRVVDETTLASEYERP
jgi:Raf kinase inhibitor-like YbhB/YbcL family protein